MNDSRKFAERATLLVHFGYLTAPLKKLVDTPDPPTAPEYQVAAARFCADLTPWRVEAAQFVRFGNASFDLELRRILGPSEKLAQGYISGAATFVTASSPSEAQRYLRDVLERCKTETIAAINQVPIEWEAHLFGEGTPYSVCMAIRDVILGAVKRVHYIDRYLEPDFFDLYLRALDRSIEVRLITSHGGANSGVQGVLALAKRAAKEFRDFKLIQCDQKDFHERDLRVDDIVFVLGTGTGNAGDHPTTFGKGDSTSNGHQVLDRLIAKGRTVTY